MNRLLTICMTMAVMAWGSCVFGAIVTFQDNFDSYADGTVTPAPNWDSTVSSATINQSVVADARALSGPNVYRFSRSASGQPRAIGNRISTATNLRQSAALSIYTVTASLYVTDDPFSIATASSWAEILVRDSSNNIGFGVRLSDNRFHANRTVTWWDGASQSSELFDYSLDEWMTIAQTVDEAAGTWEFSIKDSVGAVIFSKSGLDTRPSGFAGVGIVQLYGGANGSGDRVDNLYDDFSVTVIPEPATLGLLAVGSVLVLVRRRK